MLQGACIKRHRGQEVDRPKTWRARSIDLLTQELDQVENFDSLGEKTLQALFTPQQQAYTGDGSAALTNGQSSVSILQALICKHNGSKRVYTQ